MTTEHAAATRRPGLARLRAWPHRHPITVDTVLTLVVGLALVSLTARTPGERGWETALSAALVLPLVARRHAPLPVFGWMAAVSTVQWFTGKATVTDAALLIALYSIAAYRGRRAALLALAVLEIGIVFAVLKWTPQEGKVTAIVFLSGMTTAAYALGRNMRTRQAYLSSLEDRAHRAEHERDQQARLAAATERTRIAREMHDIVAHNLSVMIALSDGVAFAARAHPEQAEAAARQVSTTGRAALGEMHRLLGVLRGGPDLPRSPQPGIEGLPDLVAQVRTTGLPASLTVSGQPFPLSPTAQLAVYRLAQEALTNVLKHADSPAEARVLLRYRDPIVEVQIDDNGQGNLPVPASRGHGLNGMAERAAMFDGHVTAGPRPGGGWRVRAELRAGRAESAEQPSRTASPGTAATSVGGEPQ
jgi:signal transduction histidine kinase